MGSGFRLASDSSSLGWLSARELCEDTRLAAEAYEADVRGAAETGELRDVYRPCVIITSFGFLALRPGGAIPNKCLDEVGRETGGKSEGNGWLWMCVCRNKFGVEKEKVEKHQGRTACAGAVFVCTPKIRDSIIGHQMADTRAHHALKRCTCSRGGLQIPRWTQGGSCAAIVVEPVHVLPS